MARRSPSEELDRLAAGLQRVADRIRAAEDGEALFTREDVEALVENRLARERKKRRSVEAELAAVEAERDEAEAWLERLQGETGRETAPRDP